MDRPDGLTPLTLSARQRLDDAIRTVASLPFGATDCALPMLYALEQEREVDVFVVYTDSETWAGDVHPVQALRRYREQSGIPARLVVVGMVANGFTIADPDDAGMLDVVGFDTATPALLADFARGGVRTSAAAYGPPRPVAGSSMDVKPATIARRESDDFQDHALPASPCPSLTAPVLVLGADEPPSSLVVGAALNSVWNGSRTSVSLFVRSRSPECAMPGHLETVRPHITSRAMREHLANVRRAGHPPPPEQPAARRSETHGDDIVVVVVPRRGPEASAIEHRPRASVNASDLRGDSRVAQSAHRTSEAARVASLRRSPSSESIRAPCSELSSPRNTRCAVEADSSVNTEIACRMPSRSTSKTCSRGPNVPADRALAARRTIRCASFSNHVGTPRML